MTISYSTFICPLESGRRGKEAKNFETFEYLENKKSFLDKIKSIFVVFEGLSLVGKEKLADTSFKPNNMDQVLRKRGR